MSLPAAIDRNLRQAGFAGRHMRVELRGESLDLRGEQSGTLSMAIAEIKRMRVGFLETLGARSYQTLLWRGGAQDPVRIAPMRPLRDPHAYVALVRDLAARVAERRGVAAIETGSSPVFWLRLSLAVAALLVAAILVVLFVLAEEPDGTWWGSAVVIAFPVAILALIAWRYLTVHRPRAIRYLSALDRHLPRHRRRGVY
jgi:hypothetical protein